MLFWAAPDLRVVLYGAGSIRRVATPALWDRGVRITSAYAANAVPVSEYTLAAILFSLKRGWHFAFSARRESLPGQARSPAPTAARSASSPWAWSAVWYASACGPSTCAGGLRPLRDARGGATWAWISCPGGFVCVVGGCFVTHALAARDGGMILGSHIASMKRNATLINTSRGAVVREAEMVEVLEERPDRGPYSMSRTRTS